MRVAVISDTHGNLINVFDRLKLLMPDVIIHLGDYVRDADELRGYFANTDFYSVRGNCDRSSQAPEELILELEGHRIFVTHGHRQSVKDSLYGIYFAALDNEAEIGLFGHTHIPYSREKDGILLLNPGSAGSEQPTMAILHLSISEIDAEIVEI